MGLCRLYVLSVYFWLCSLNANFVCFILREIFDELLETEKNSQALSMDVGKTTRQASWGTDSWVGSVHCVFFLTVTHLTLLCSRRIWNSTWCGSNKQLRAKPNDENCSCAECSMLIVLWQLWSHICSWLSSFSPTRVALPFVLGIHVVNIYICTYTHIYVEWMEP